MKGTKTIIAAGSIALFFLGSILLATSVLATMIMRRKLLLSLALFFCIGGVYAHPRQPEFRREDFPCSVI
jgi:hypothetical protein